MLPGLSLWISLLFMATALATLIFFTAAGPSRKMLLFVLGWTALQVALGLAGFYQDTVSLPPRTMVLAVLPTVIGIVVLFNTASGRAAVDRLDLRTLTWLHLIRIPVEVVLWLLVHRQLLSESMSVGGTNFDVLSGLSAPVVALLAFRNGQVNRRLLRIWNWICLLLLANVVITASLAIPSPIQQHSFDQPNIAVLYFPFNLLPSVVVPLVLLAHLAALRRLR